MRRIDIGLQKRVYVPGEEITGYAHVYLDEPVSQRSATLYLTGKERTEVAYQAGKNRRVAVQEDEFLHQDSAMPLPIDEKGKVKLGDYDIPFKFALPQTCPMTYVGNHTKILYEIIARIDVPLGFDVKESVEINVTSSGPQTLQPQPISAFSEAWNNPQRTSSPSLTFALEKSEYRRGEVLGGKCNFRNPTAKNVRNIDVLLKCTETATARGHTVATKILEEVSKIPIGGKAVQGGTLFSIRIPQEAPPTYESSLSNVRYILGVSLDIAWESDVAANASIRVLP